MPFARYEDNENRGSQLASSHGLKNAKKIAVFALLASGLMCPLKFEFFWKPRKLFTIL